MAYCFLMISAHSVACGSFSLEMAVRRMTVCASAARCSNISRNVESCSDMSQNRLSAGRDDLIGRLPAAGAAAHAVGDDRKHCPGIALARDNGDPVLLLVAVADVGCDASVDFKAGHAMVEGRLVESIIGFHALSIATMTARLWGLLNRLPALA